jgi:hypothetical protein
MENRWAIRPGRIEMWTHGWIIINACRRDFSFWIYFFSIDPDCLAFIDKWGGKSSFTKALQK